MARTTLSLAMIVRDEASTLARCLESVQAIVDEIVIVDTGSEDATPEIAERLGARVHHLSWPSDFSRARQDAWDRATGDWIFWLDADDVVVGAESIRQSAEAASPAVPGFCWRYEYARDRHGNITCECWRERAVRRPAGFRWTGAVHEVLTGPKLGALVRDPRVVVRHEPDPSRTRNPRRNLDILRAEYAAAGGRPSARTLLYLGLELAALGESGEALPLLERFLAISRWTEQNYFTWLALADLHRRGGRFDRALDAAERAFVLDADRPEACFSIAETRYFQKQWEAVVQAVEAGRAKACHEASCVANPMNVRFRWIIHYTNALFHLGRVNEALAWTTRALAICPDDAWHRANQTFFERELWGATAARE